MRARILTASYNSPGDQQLRLHLDLKMCGITIVKQSNCNQGLGGSLCMKRCV